jgi:guanylate kinase
MNKKGTLFVISGPSGVGKGTVCEEVFKDKDALSLSLSVSATTRTPRPIDQEGVTYFFKTQEEFESMIEAGAFLEWATYNGNYYGTPLAPVEETLNKGINVILEIEVQGALQVKKNLPSAVSIFITPPDLHTLHSRLKGRATETEEEISRRIAAAEWELKQQNHYDYVIINDVLEDTVQSVKDIIQARSVVL